MGVWEYAGRERHYLWHTKQQQSGRFTVPSSATSFSSSSSSGLSLGLAVLVAVGSSELAMHNLDTGTDQVRPFTLLNFTVHNSFINK